LHHPARYLCRSGAPDEPRPTLIDDGSDGSVVGTGVRVLDRRWPQL
jgi:hypothetical protein